MTLRQIIVIDEAWKILRRNYKSDIGTPIIERMMAQVREFGIGIIAADQNLSELPDTVKGNCYTIGTLSLSSGKDIEEVAKTMRLNKEQADVIAKLDVGQAVVKLAGRYPEPVLIQIPEFNLERYVSNEEVDEFMEPILKSYKITPCIPLNEMLERKEEKPFDRKSEKVKGEAKKTDGFKKEAEEKKSKQSVLIRDFLIHIEKHPFMNVTERYSALGINTYRGNKIQKEVVEDGLVKEIRVSKSVYLELTEKGMDAIGSDKGRLKGRGSFEHILYQEKIREYFERLGYSAYVEKDLYGKSIDVLVNKDGLQVAIEVEMSMTDHILENISRDYAVGVNEVVIVTKKDLLSKIKRKVEKDLGDGEVRGLSFEVIDKFLKA